MPVKYLGIVTRTASLVCAIICFLVATQITVSRKLVLSRFASLEENDAKVQIQRVENELANILGKLKAFGSDWGFWDDTYQFVVDGHSTYIGKNLMDEMFADQRLNFMMFFDDKKKLIHQQFYDIVDNKKTDPDSSAVRIITSFDSLFDHRDNLDIHTGIVMTSVAPLLIVAAPILSSTREGPAHGTFLIGRYLDGHEIERISEQTRLAVTLQANSGATNSKPVKFKTRIIDDTLLIASTVLTDISGQPAATLEVRLERTMFREGYAMWKQHVLSLIVVGCFVIVALIYLLNRLVLHQLVALSGEVDRITDTGDPALRIHVQGNDEIATLGDRINVMLDTVQRLQAVQQENEQYLQNLLDTVQCGILVVAADSRRIVAVNKTGATMLGKTADTLVGGTCQQFVAIPNEHGAHTLDQSEDGNPQEFVIVRDDTTKIPVLKSIAGIKRGNDTYVIESFIDIGPLKKVQAGLRASEARYRQFFEEDLTGDFIVTVDGQIIDCNLAYARMFGYDSVDEIKKTNVTSQYPIATDRQLFLEKIRRDGKLERYESELRRRDGSPLFCVGNEIGEFTENGELVRIWGYLFDDTKRVLLEREIRQNQKLEAIGTLAGGIAHDFNNILAGIIGYAEIVIRKESADSQVKEYLQKILAAGEKARELILQILAFSRKTEAEVQPVRLQPAVQEVMQLLRASLPTTISIREQLDSSATILADPVQIHQILLNLCTNAGHAMRENGGTLSVSLEQVSPQDIAGQSPLPGKFVRIRIGDTGHGIPEDIRTRIFDPFFTTKNKDEGTGLGLSMVHGIVTNLKGQIIVDSEIGVGTVFDVYLPLAEEITEEVVAAEPQATAGTEHIVYVDDEPFLVEIGREILMSQGYRVSQFINSAKALEFITENSAAIDLVISDLTMPGLTGIDLARRLRERGICVPMIIYTGYDEDLDRENLPALGIENVLLKPVSYLLMAEKVREVLDRVKQSRQQA